MPQAKKSKRKDRSHSDNETKGRFQNHNKMIPHRSKKIDDLIHDWGDRERQAIVVEAEDILESSLHGILSPRENKKSASEGNPKTNGMSSLERQASNSDGSSGEQPRARYQYQYEQHPLYHEDHMTHRSRSAGYSVHSEYRREDYYRGEDSRQVAKTTSAQQSQYLSYDRREFRGVERERRGRPPQGARPAEFDLSYQRDAQLMAAQNGQQYHTPTLERSISSTSSNGNYLPGPPKPPRRQQSLNRIHIPSGPDYDEGPRSPSDSEFHSTSPEMGSPKQWQTSPLIQPQRGFAIVGSPVPKQSAPRQQPPQRVAGNRDPKEYNRASTYARSQEINPANQYRHQSQPQRRDRSRSPASHNLPPSPPPKQPNIVRQSSMPVSHSPPQILQRKQNVQLVASLERRPDDYKSQGMSKYPRAESYNSNRRPAKAAQDSYSQMKGSEPKSRPLSDRKGHSSKKTEQVRRSQPTNIPEKVRQRKVSSPEQSFYTEFRETERRSSVPLVSTEKFIVPDKQTATYATPQYKTLPSRASKEGGLGALLIADKDHDPVTMEAAEWMSPSSTEYFSKPEYVSDSGISSLREVPSRPKVKSPGPSGQGVATTWDRDYSVKPEMAFNEDTAQYQLYGDGPLDYSSYGHNKDNKSQLPRQSSYERQLAEDRPGWQHPVPPSHSYSLERKVVEQPNRQSPRKELFRLSSLESPDPDWGSNASHGMVPQSAQQPNRYETRQQYPKPEKSPVAVYAAKISHYDYPTKHYSADLESAKPASPYSAPADGQHIKSSLNRYPTETDVVGTEPAIDGGEAYWGMESRMPPPKFSYRQSSPEKVPSYQSSHNPQKASVGTRSRSPVYSERAYDERVSYRRPAADIQENRIQMTEASVVQSAPAVERQSRYDRLKQHAGTQRRAQSMGGGGDSQRRSKSLTRLGSPDKTPSSSELPKKALQSKSTDDLEELKKKGVSRGAALFIRMMQQASREEQDYDLSSVEPVAIDNYVGTPKLFQPQITKTGEPILELNRPVTSPDSDSRASFDSDSRFKFSKSNMEPLLQTKDKSSVAYASPPPNTEFSDDSPSFTTRHGNQNPPADWQAKQDRLKRTPIVEKSPSTLSTPKSDSEPVTTVRHGKQEVPVEWLIKQQNLKRTASAEKLRIPLTKSKSLDYEPIVGRDENSNLKKHAGSVTKMEQQKHSRYVEITKISANKVQTLHSEPTESYPSSQVAPTQALKKTDAPKRVSSVEKSPGSPSKLNSPDAEPKPKPTIRHGKQEVPLEWMEVLERLRGKPKGQSSDSLSPVKSRDKDQRVSADFEDALSELEHMYSVLDQEADDLLFCKSSKSFDQRIAELPPALQRRLKDLKEYATAQRNKRRARRERSKSDLALKTKTPSKTPAPEGQKKQEVPPYRTSGSAVKPSKHASLDVPVKTSDRRQRAHHYSPRNEQSSSDEEVPSRPRSTYQLYRKPRSNDNIGCSSKRSPELSRQDNRPSQSIFERPSKKSDPSPRKPGSYFESITGLDLPKYEPSAKNSDNKSQKPVEDSPHHTKVQEVVTKSSAAHVNTSQITFEKLDAGSRLSVDSVSTVDSFQLSQPFDEMSSEYYKMSTDHRMDMASDGDVSPSQQSSSMESLVLSVASPGHSRMKRQPPKNRRKQGKEISATDRQKADSEKTANQGPVPLATFDEELDLDIQDPTPYAAVTQARYHRSSQERNPDQSDSEDISFNSSARLSTLNKGQPRQQASKTIRPVTKLRKRYDASKHTKSDKQDSYNSTDSEAEEQRAPAKHCGMSGRSRHQRIGNNHLDSRSPRASSGYGLHSTETSKRVTSDAPKRGAMESGYGSKGKEAISVADAVPSRYSRPPRHDKEKVDSIRDEYLSKKAANGEVTRVPRYSRGRATTAAGEKTVESAISPVVVDSLSRVRSNSDSSEDPESRKARIAKYKEQRKRELADKYGLKDSSSAPTSSDSDPASRHRRDWKARLEESRIPTPENRTERRESRRKTSQDSAQPSSPRSPRTTEETDKTRSGLRERSDSVSSTSSETRVRKDSVISAETQQLVDTLEASRAARRERMRRSISDMSTDATEKIIARHRSRKSSITSEDGDVFTGAARNTDDRSPVAHISDTDSLGSSSATSGERFRSKSEPIDPAVLSVAREERKPVSEEYKSPPDRTTSTKQSRSRSRRQNVSITAAQIKEASIIGQKMVERKLSLTSSTQSPTSPSNSDSADAVRKQPSSATPDVSSGRETDEPEPKSASPPTETQVPKSPTRGERGPSDDSVFVVASKTDTVAPDESKVEETIESTTVESTQSKPVQEKPSKVKNEKEVVMKSAKSPSPRVTSPEKLESGRKSPEKKTKSRSPEKTSKGSSQRIPRASSTETEMSSSSKVHLKRPQIPQVLDEVRKRRDSNGSNSSFSDGMLSPTHRHAKAKGSDSDSRASPTLSPTHRLHRKITEPSSRIQELAKPRRVEAKKESATNGSDSKKSERRTPTSPEKRIKVRADVSVHSRTENGVVVERNKGRDNAKPKESKEVTVSTKITQKPPASKEKVPPQVKAKSKPAKVETRQAKSAKEAPKTMSKTQSKSTKAEPKDIAIKRQTSFKSKKSPDTPEQTDVKKVALATKDKELMAVMRARALSLQDSDEEEETEVRQEEDATNQDQKPEDVIKVPVAQRLQVFKSAEKLDVKPPMPPTSPGSPRSPKSPRRSSQIKIETAEPEAQRTPTEKLSEAEAEPDELATLTVSEKKQMFTQISKQKDEEAAKAKPRRRFHRIRQSERSQTQPVTPEEFNSATSLANQNASEGAAEATNEVEVDEDDVSRLSLAEKMKLFHEKAEVDKPPPKVEVPKRKKRTDSRFKTQPVTSDEVKKAARISPLVRSFTKPPDEVAGLPLKEQIALVYGSQERLERRSSLIDGRHPPSVGPELSSPEKKGILKEPSFEKVDSSSDEPPKSILKSDYDVSHDKLQKGRGILKSEDAPTVHSDPEVRSILKDKSESQSSDLEETKSILRKDSRQEKEDTDSDRAEKSILKKDSTSSKPPLQCIMRKTSDAVSPEEQTDALKPTGSPMKPALKKDDSRDSDLDSSSAKPPLPSVIQKTSDTASAEGQMGALKPKDCPRKAALMKDDSQDADVDSGTDDPVKRKSGLAMEHLRLRKGKANLRAEGYSSSDSEPEVRARARSTPNSPIVEIRTVKKKQIPELDPTKKRPRSPSAKDAKERGLSPRRLKSPDPGRYKTQPVTPEEMAKVRQLTEPVKTSGSIAERLQALQKSGQEDWQKRINKYNDSPRSGMKDFLKVPGAQSHRASDEDVDLASCSISKRLELIQSSQTSWKKRVEEKDVTQFTVSGKMTKAGKEVVETSPQLKRAGSTRVKRGGSFRGRVTLGDKKDNGKKESEKKETEDKEATASNKSEDKSESTSSVSVSVSSGEKQESKSSSANATTTESESESGFRIVKKKIAIMKPDDATFAEFFSSSSTVITESAMISKDRKASLDDVTVSDFDALSDIQLPKLTALSRNRMSLRPKRRTHGNKNPIRALRTRSNVITEYEEVKKEMVETQPLDKTAVMKARRVELTSKVRLHQSARKGLASKEDISKGLQKLQKVKDVREMEGKLSQLLPYKDLMLLHIKGRRFVQVRLIEPSTEMLNTGDCFVLVTPKECFLWIGEYSNVIERSKASEIAQFIQTTRDLGCKAPSVVTIEESKGKPLGSTRDWKRFMATLGGEDDVKDIARADEDELHEIYITETNMVYKVEGESLVPSDDYWGSPPKFSMLNTNEIYVFDFGSELYIWQGKQTSSKERQTAAKLAEIVWQRGYDYREFDVNPLWPGHSKKPIHGEERPEWALFGKTTEHMETVLFQNKFIDWPSESRLIKVKTNEDEQKPEPAPELVPYDASKMIQPSKEKTDLILENTNLGRGRGSTARSNGGLAHFEKIDQRGNEINTLSVVMWHVLEYEHSILPKESFGQFHEGDTYVVRWQYRVESTGMRDLKGNLSKRGQGHGRERCVYFFWQGLGSTINEKGASALMTVELDEERGPQRQVIQGKEPPAFLQLFDGRMVVHIGKREEVETNTSGPNRLYCVRSEHAEEALLVETECKTNQLRSRTSFVLVSLKKSLKKATVCVWHGAKSSKATRGVAVHAANMLKENKPLETGMEEDWTVSLEEMEEGQETSTFKKLLGVDRSAYDSAIGDPLVYNYTPRLFHMTSKSGVFVATEILNQSRSEEMFTPFPFQQTDLYGASQPAQFLFDNHYEVYLWQGWWPEDQDKKTGSAKMRWDVDRRCAMETVMAYCKEKRSKNPPKAYLVYAGLEPLTFINLFPWWRIDNSVAEINKKDGKSGDHAILVREVLEKLTKAQYTFAELQQKPLPDGVDPLKLETYLSEEEFKEKLKMGREEFYKMPSWKQLKIKKEVGLF